MVYIIPDNTSTATANSYSNSTTVTTTTTATANADNALRQQEPLLLAQEQEQQQQQEQHQQQQQQHTIVHERKRGVDPPEQVTTPTFFDGQQHQLQQLYGFQQQEQWQGHGHGHGQGQGRNPSNVYTIDDDDDDDDDYIDNEDDDIDDDDINDNVYHDQLPSLEEAKAHAGIRSTTKAKSSTSNTSSSASASLFFLSSLPSKVATSVMMVSSQLSPSARQKKKDQQMHQNNGDGIIKKTTTGTTHTNHTNTIDEEDEDEGKRSVRVFLTLSFFILLASISLAIGIVAGRNVKEARDSSNNSSSNDSMNSNDNVPTFGPEFNDDPSSTTAPSTGTINKPNSPTSTTTDPLEATQVLVVDYEWSSGIDVYNSTSPQGKACNWVATIDELKTYLTDVELFAERYALAVLYYSLDGDNWLYSANFMNANKPVCDWNGLFDYNESDSNAIAVKVGISCFDDNNDSGGSDSNDGIRASYVKEIYMPSNDMKGTLPSELKLLRRLQDLNLYNNNIRGTIPTQYVAMTELTALQLEKNALTYLLPSFFDQLPNIKVINLAMNEFMGSIPSSYGNITQLEFLNLGDNDLTAGLPSLRGLPNLKSLQVYNNYLSDTIEDDIFLSWPSLQVLDVSKNILSGYIPRALFSTENLVVADLHDNSFMGELPTLINSKQTLKFLALNRNRLVGQLDERIAFLRHLDHLDLSDNYFTGTISSDIGSLTNLKYLFLARNIKLANQTIPTEIGKLTNLQDLSFQGTNRIGPIPTELQYCKKLILLDLNNNDLSGELPMELGALRDVEHILLKDNRKLTGSIPADYSLMEKLKTFILYGTRIDSGASQLCNNITGISSLTEFVADCTVLTDCTPDTCCTDCCDGKKEDCATTEWYSDVDPLEINGYVRQGYYFHNESLVNRPLPAKPTPQESNAYYYEQYGTNMENSTDINGTYSSP